MKKLALLSLLSLSCVNTWANTPLEPYTEVSNLNTQGYVWKIQLTENAQQDIDVKLLNPNKKFPQLNKRAIEIAQQHYQIPELYVSANAPLSLAEDGITRFYTQPYLLDIHFKLESELISYYTTSYLQNPSIPPILCKRDGLSDETVSVTLNFTANTDGTIPYKTISVQNSSHDVQQIKAITHYLMQKLRFARLITFNIDGMAIPIKTNQTFHVTCLKQEKPSK